MPKKGFNDQWIAISRKGEFNDSRGKLCDLSDDFFQKVIANFTPDTAPLVVGHPQDNHPAFGWVSAVRLNNGELEAQFADTDDEFEKLCADGKFKKRSASFYLDGRLRHVGFLGAIPPAIKGLRDIQFNDGDSVTVEISFNEEENTTMKDEEVDKVADSLLGKLKNMFKPEPAASVVLPAAPTTASFSEADAKKLIEAAVAQAKTEAKAEAVAEFSEKIKGLEDAVNANSASGKRSEIVSFVEGLKPQYKHQLKRRGVIEFLEACAGVDAAAESELISFSEGEGDQKVEHKFTMFGWAKELLTGLPETVEFGEKFGNIVATKEVQETEMKRPEKVKSLKDKVGVVEDGGAK